MASWLSPVESEGGLDGHGIVTVMTPQQTFGQLLGLEKAGGWSRGLRQVPRRWCFCAGNCITRHYLSFGVTWVNVGMGVT